MERFLAPPLKKLVACPPSTDLGYIWIIQFHFQIHPRSSSITSQDTSYYYSTESRHRNALFGSHNSLTFISSQAQSHTADSHIHQNTKIKPKTEDREQTLHAFMLCQAKSWSKKSSYSTNTSSWTTQRFWQSWFKDHLITGRFAPNLSRLSLCCPMVKEELNKPSLTIDHRGSKPRGSDAAIKISICQRLYLWIYMYL